MTSADLVKTVAAEIRTALADVKLRTEYAKKPTEENFVSVNVFEQYLPQDLFETTSYYPLVIVEWLDTKDDLDEEKSIATIGLTMGTYAKEADGFLDALHLAEVIRQRLLTHRILAKKFRLVDEVNWTTPEAQPIPFYIILDELKYNIQQPVQEFVNIY